MNGARLCDYLEWDSSFFGIRIGRVAENRLTGELLAEVLTWAEEHSLDCLYFLADPDPGTVRLAEDGGFRLVDVRVTLLAQIEARDRQPWDRDGLRRALPEDIQALRAIAETSHGDSRFYQDHRFLRPRCDELFRTWIERSCHGYAQEVLVAECRGRVAGYVTCHLDGQKQGRIGLLAVASWARGLGLGTRLVEAGLSWFAEQGVKDVRVATQGRNVKALRLYGRSRFLVHCVQLWYHRWSPRRAEGPG